MSSSQEESQKITVNSLLQINVISFDNKFINNKSETVYTIEITNLFNKKKWTLEKTYKDIELLHTELTKFLPEVPSFSSFTLFKSSSSYNTIIERQTEINNYLNECVSRKDILSTLEFSNFLNLKNNFPEILYNSPELIDTINNPNNLTLHEIQYLEKENILFALFSDFNFTAKVDSYIKSTELLKWNEEKITPQQRSENDLNNPNLDTSQCGAFFVYKIITYKNKNNVLKIKLENIFAKYFKEITGSFFYDLENNIFIIGFSSGLIIFYKILPESTFTQFDYMSEIKYHSKKVTGLSIFNKNFFSCSNDGKFCIGVINMIYHINYSAEIIHENYYGYNKLYHDQKNNRIFLSTNNGHLEVYQTNINDEELPIFIKDVETSNYKIPLNDLTSYNIKNYLFSCSDNGNISVFDLGKPGQEKTTKELSYFNYYDAKIKIKTAIYDSEKNEVISGDNYGRLIFWSLKYGKPIHVTKISQKSIEKIRYIENSEEPNKLLLISCLDNNVYFVKLPLKWLDNDEVEKYEKIEIKSRSDLNAMMKIQDFLAKDEDYNSDEDSLNGWDYFANDAKEEMDKNKNKK